jgi:glutamyl-tRNA synthetase
VKDFDISRIGTSPAIFDKERLDWFNGHYIRKLSPEELTERAMPFLLDGVPEAAHVADRAYITRVLVLDQERFKTLADVPDKTRYFFVEPEYDASLLLGKNMDAEKAARALAGLLPVLADLREWDAERLMATLDQFVTDQGYVRTKADGTQVPDRGPVFMLVRVAASGRKETPGLPEMLAVLGKERTLKRLEAARHKLDAQPARA